MKVSENWVREWVNPLLNTQQLADQLTMAGIEVDSLHPAAPSFTGVVVGKILSVEPHPNADKLNVCQVDVAEDKPLTIVTNQPMTPDLRVACAKVGAFLPSVHKENESLTPADMRGITSYGMFCSPSTLGIENAAKEIWTFDTDAVPGTDVWDYCKLDDTLIEVDLTPNRGDCSSVLGLARELSVLNKMPLTPVKIKPIAAIIPEKLTIKVSAREACPRYVGRIIKGVCQKRTPLWMQEKLRRSDIRSVHPVVDILNYVMLELGQPMHAFDASTLSGNIQVRLAQKDEKITLLGGQEVSLHDGILVIADDKKAQAVAGIMGGEESAVLATTTDVFLESALFSAPFMAGKARQLGLHTDSSYRFERGVDPLLQTLAIERATQLILDYCGGSPGPVVESSDETALRIRQSITFQPSRFKKIIGEDISHNVMKEIITRLGCEITEETSDSWTLSAPSYRYDLNDDIDIIEELARIVGYSELSSRDPLSHLTFSKASQCDVSNERLKHLLVDLGYQEVITYSFVDEASQKQLMGEQKTLALINPISSDMNVMRLSLWPGLLNAVRHNQNRQQSRMKLFEIGMCFYYEGTSLKQDNFLGLVITGEANPEQWNAQKRKVDFYDLKGHVETLFKTIGVANDALRFEAAEHSACHPGQCAAVYLNNHQVGTIGKLHPKCQTQWGMEGAIYLAHIRLDALSRAPLPQFTRPSRFPENRRDIAVLVNESVSSEQLINTVRKSSGEILQHVWVFDVYMGKGIEPGQKSIALGLILQHPSRTLVDEEMDTLVHEVVMGLEKDFGAKLRD